MKYLIKMAGLLACGVVASSGTVYANSDDLITMEANAPQGVTLNRKGEMVNSHTKAMVDENRPVGGTSIRYYSSSAAAMQPLINNRNDYNGGGCSSSTTGSMSVDQAVDLPDKSKIVSFTVLGNDTSNTSAVSAYLSRVGETGSYTIIKSATSGTSNQPGRFSIGGFINHTMNYTEGLLTRLSVSSPDVEICGIRIGYVPPDVASDVIFVNNFYR